MNEKPHVLCTYDYNIMKQMEDGNYQCPVCGRRILKSDLDIIHDDPRENRTPPREE